jgi:hypothetical protein
VPGRLVEYLGDTTVAMLYPADPTRVIYFGHPGRVDRNWDEPYGGHVVVTWHGLENAGDSNESSGCGWDESERTYPGLGWIDQATYDQRVSRVDEGLAPLTDPPTPGE